MKDPIVEEVREFRAAIAAEFGDDRSRFWAWAREEERKGRLAAPLNFQKLLPAEGVPPSLMVTSPVTSTSAA